MCTGIGRALNLSVAAYPRLGRPTAKSCAFAGDSVPSVMAQPVMMGQPVMAQAQPVQQPQMQMMQVQVRQPHAHALPPAQHMQVHRLRAVPRHTPARHLKAHKDHLGHVQLPHQPHRTDLPEPPWSDYHRRAASGTRPSPCCFPRQVPAGMMGGQMLQVQTPSGMMQVQIPQGLQAGQVFQMQVPMRAPQQQAMPMAQPVMQQPMMQQPMMQQPQQVVIQQQQPQRVVIQQQQPAVIHHHHGGGGYYHSGGDGLGVGLAGGLIGGMMLGAAMDGGDEGWGGDDGCWGGDDGGWD